MSGESMTAEQSRLNEISSTIIGSSYEVANDKGIGFLEKVYERCLFVELTQRGLKVEPQKRITIKYKGVVVGDYFADLLVEDSVLVEVKHCDGIADEHIAQCINYLRATGLKLCILINFGKPTIK